MVGLCRGWGSGNGKCGRGDGLQGWNGCCYFLDQQWFLIVGFGGSGMPEKAMHTIKSTPGHPLSHSNHDHEWV